MTIANHESDVKIQEALDNAFDDLFAHESETFRKAAKRGHGVPYLGSINTDAVNETKPPRPLELLEETGLLGSIVEINGRPVAQVGSARHIEGEGQSAEQRSDKSDQELLAEAFAELCPDLSPETHQLMAQGRS